MPEHPVSNETLVERVARLETRVGVKFEAIEDSMTLTRELSDKAKVLAREQLTAHLASINEFQKRMDKLEGTFATTNWVNSKFEAANQLFVQQLNGLTKLVYIGVGGVLVIELFLRFIAHP